MEDIPWQIVVLIFLAFFGWLRGKFQEARSRRAEMQINRERHRRRAEHLKEQEEQEQAYQSPYRNQPEPEREPSPPPRPTVQTVQPPGSLQDLFEQVTQAQRSTVQQERTPPPLPETESVSPVKTVTSSDYDIAIERPFALKEKRKAGQDSKVASSIKKAFSSRGDLRNALILKEILDTPKGLH